MRLGLVDSLASPRKKRKLSKGAGDSDLPSFVTFEFGGEEVRARPSLKPNAVLSLNTGFAPIFEAIAKEIAGDSDDAANNLEDKTPVKMPDGGRCYPGRLMAAHAHPHTRAQLHTRTHTHTHTHTLARTGTHAPGHARARAHTHAHPHTHTQTHTHAHRDTHTHTHTHSHTRTQVSD